MTGDDTASLIYLSLLGAALVGYFIASNRMRMGETLRAMVLWGIIFAGVVAVAGLWPTLRDQVMPQQSVSVTGEIRIPRSFDGHYRIVLQLNDVPVEFIVDTGATDMVLSQQDARRIGFEPDTLAYTGKARTANGIVPMATVVLDTVAIDGVLEDQRLPASVNGGEMEMSLLGMSYLSRFGRISIENNVLLLEG
ncbi:retropepsin-like aspartic protease family protein [Palleronia caenipelagi]|uniref:TIGR02281 family clan AA aspartic protease n=1 Tax=Palleronia caenipelagi TaxID=2489174 RepID=A0A547Q317_9RHOB|nr:TIGR02281 family clan AA aspartic protease [Palleronia caenipelagi]TRD20775.1 TIGR02281 family clan AA aspartic protease [Palleronia caenipelagi]